MRRVWRRLDSAIESRVNEVTTSWLGTPYCLGQASKGFGVDCLNLTCAIQNELAGDGTSNTRLLPGDASLHQPEKCRAVVAHLLRAYDAVREARDSFIEPGDIIVIGWREGFPHHALTATGTPNVFCHSLREVCLSGFPPGEILHVLRHRNKISWLSTSKSLRHPSASPS